MIWATSGGANAAPSVDPVKITALNDACLLAGNQSATAVIATGYVAACPNPSKNRHASNQTNEKNTLPVAFPGVSPVRRVVPAQISAEAVSTMRGPNLSPHIPVGT